MGRHHPRQAGPTPLLDSAIPGAHTERQAGLPKLSGPQYSCSTAHRSFVRGSVGQRPRDCSRSSGANARPGCLHRCSPEKIGNIVEISDTLHHKRVILCMHSHLNAKAKLQPSHTQTYESRTFTFRSAKSQGIASHGRDLALKRDYTTTRFRVAHNYDCYELKRAAEHSKS